MSRPHEGRPGPYRGFQKLEIISAARAHCAGEPPTRHSSAGSLRRRAERCMSGRLVPPRHGGSPGLCVAPPTHQGAGPPTHYGGAGSLRRRAERCMSGRLVPPRHGGSRGLCTDPELDPRRPGAVSGRRRCPPNPDPKPRCSLGGAQASCSRSLSMTLSSGTVGVTATTAHPRGASGLAGLSRHPQMHGSSGGGCGARRVEAGAQAEGYPDVVPSERGLGASECLRCSVV